MQSVMFRPLRRVRQREANYVKAEVKGMLHSEELALRRALQASLIETTSPEKSEPKPQKEETPTDQPLKTLDPSSSPIQCTAHTKRRKTEPPFEGCDLPSPASSSSVPCSSISSTFEKTGGVHQSPSPSPVGSPGSIDSSLKLVLSTSSWSSTSTSSNWSSAPSSPSESSSRTPPKDSPKKRRKVVQTLSSSKSTQRRGKPGKGKGKLTVNPSLFGEPLPANVKTRTKKDTLKSQTKKKAPKKALKSPGKSPKGKASAADRKPTEKKRKSPKASKPKSGTLPECPEMEDNPLSPEAVLVYHDHCYFAKGSTHPHSTDMKVLAHKTASKGAKRQEELSLMETKSPGSNGCIFQAQRKFTQNRVPSPPPRPPTDVGQNFNKLKVIPKTEDFIAFLCMRGYSTVPRAFRKFNKPWTPLIKTKNGQRVSVRGRSLCGNSSKAYRSRVSKKLEFPGK